MCGSTAAQPTPPVVVRDPVAEQAKADATATQAANAEIVSRRRRLAGESLLTGGAAGFGQPGQGSTLLPGANPASGMKYGTGATTGPLPGPPRANGGIMAGAVSASVAKTLGGS